MLLLFRFGWAKPVPVDPRYFKNPRRDMFLVSIAGVSGNSLTAFLFGMIARLFPYPFLAVSALRQFIFLMIVINIGLVVFNLNPMPPLDGSKLLFAGLLKHWGQKGPAEMATKRRFTYPDDTPNAYPDRRRGGPPNQWVVTQPQTLVGTAGHLHPGGLYNDLKITRGGTTKLLFRSEAKYWEPAGAVSWDVSMTATRRRSSWPRCSRCSGSSSTLRSRWASRGCIARRPSSSPTTTAGGTGDGWRSSR